MEARKTRDEARAKAAAVAQASAAVAAAVAEAHARKTASVYSNSFTLVTAQARPAACRLSGCRRRGTEGVHRGRAKRSEHHARHLQLFLVAAQAHGAVQLWSLVPKAPCYAMLCYAMLCYAMLYEGAML